MITFIALAKGELGRDTERYLQNYGLAVRLDGRPLQFVQRIGNRTFRPMKAKDVSWYVAETADYGITGEDLAKDYLLGSGNKLKIVERLGFGKGDLVVFAKYPPNEIRSRMKGDTVRVAVPNYYANLLTRRAGECIKEAFGEFASVVVDGSTESFVADGTADIGFDLTTFFTRPAAERDMTTISANGLTILERIMTTEAVVVSKPCYTDGDFRRMLGAPRKKERRTVTIGNMSEIEVISFVENP